MSKRIFILGVLIIFVISTIIPMTIGYKLKISFEDKSQFVKTGNKGQISNVWPLYKNDPQLTGRCVYDTSHNNGGEKWKYYIDDGLRNTVVIDKDEVLYTISCWNGTLYAIYNNGTMKWKKELVGWGEAGAPAIGPDGTIYAGTSEKFYAFYPNGTQKWVLGLPIVMSYNPMVDNNGIVYIGAKNGYLYAIYPNGTIKWEYSINEHPFIGSPAADFNGNVYITDCSSHLYCLNPNGTLKWSYEKVNIEYEPVIGNDGTIYVVSYGLTALYPNGTIKWYIEYDKGWYGFPSITHDGKIILTTNGCDFVTALNQVDGSIIWQYRIGDTSQTNDVSRAVIGGDGTIYFAYTAYSDSVAFLCALNPDGSLKWETYLDLDMQYDLVDIDSEPSIGSDGIVYITTYIYPGGGYIHAIGKDNIISPEPPTIIGPSHVRYFINYEYTLNCSLPAGQNVYYFIDWDDQRDDYVIYQNDWIGPFPSEEKVKVLHFWEVWGIKNSNVNVMVRCEDDRCSPSTYFKVIIPKTIEVSSVSFLKFLDYYPILQKFLYRLK